MTGFEDEGRGSRAKEGGQPVEAKRERKFGSSSRASTKQLSLGGRLDFNSVRQTPIGLLAQKLLNSKSVVLF